MNKYPNKVLVICLSLIVALATSLAFAEEPLIPNNSASKTESSSKFEFWKTEKSDYSEPVASKQPVGLMFDRYFSSTFGSSLMISINRGYQLLDDTLIPSTEGDTSLAMMAGRFGNLLFIQGTVVGLQTITQHEVFGHGFRAREFHVPVISYRVTPWSGRTTFDANKYNQLSQSEKMAFVTGGMEANSILAKEVRSGWLESQTIDSREAHLYLFSSFDQTEYILDTKRKGDKTFSSGHDVMNYINGINQWYQKPVLTPHKLRQRAIIDFLDPYLFYSFYSLGQYVVEGNHTWEYPMISIGEYRYLPLMRTALAPYGSEYQLINLIKSPEYVIQATLRYGNTGGRHSSGLGIEVANLFTSDLLRLDGKADLWNQPKLFVQNAAAAKSKMGGALSVIGRYRVVDKIDLVGQAGYKTTGFMQGEALKHSPILRVGFAAYL